MADHVSGGAEDSNGVVFAGEGRSGFRGGILGAGAVTVDEKRVVVVKECGIGHRDGEEGSAELAAEAAEEEEGGGVEGRTEKIIM